MRRRLLVSTLVVAVTAVLLLGLPLAFVFSRLQISAADRQVQNVIPRLEELVLR